LNFVKKIGSHNNKSDVNTKNRICETVANLKRSSTLIDLPNSLLKCCTRALDHPV